MECAKFKQQLTALLQQGKLEIQICEEMYFYVMGQFLMFALMKTGGLDRRMRELNYITNPYIPIDIKEIERRAMRFLKNFHESGGYAGHKGDLMYRILGEYRLYKGEWVNNQRACEEAFYLGLHSENVIAEEGE